MRYALGMAQGMNLREYIDTLRTEGYTVQGSKDEDPILIDPQGKAVETWREDYPYDELMDRDEYDEAKYQLQVELLKFQYWSEDTGAKHVLVFEGRDAAGKGGTIKRFMEHLNPRSARTVALPKPSSTEKGQWYFQRYVNQLPKPGEMVFFDRSWYNRAIVEPVNDFCTSAEYNTFMGQVNDFERMLVESGTYLIKIYLSITREEQARRFQEIRGSRLKRWKMTPVDERAQELWDVYTSYKKKMFAHTDTDLAPWTVIQADRKSEARIEVMQHLLQTIPFVRTDSDAG